MGGTAGARADAAPPGEGGRSPAPADEDHAERLDRELIELLNELRVVLPGVQVLFAFLLTVPFTGRFGDLSGVQRGTFFAAFLCAGVAAALLIAPTAYHRLRWREFDKERMLQTSNRLALGGLSVLGLGMLAVVFLITDLVVSVAAALGVTAAAAGLLSWLWVALPLSRKVRDRSS